MASPPLERTAAHANQTKPKGAEETSAMAENLSRFRSLVGGLGVGAGKKKPGNGQPNPTLTSHILCTVFTQFSYTK